MLSSLSTSRGRDNYIVGNFSKRLQVIQQGLFDDVGFLDPALLYIGFECGFRLVRYVCRNLGFSHVRLASTFL